MSNRRRLEFSSYKAEVFGDTKIPEFEFGVEYLSFGAIYLNFFTIFILFNIRTCDPVENSVKTFVPVKICRYNVLLKGESQYGSLCPEGTERDSSWCSK